MRKNDETSVYIVDFTFGRLFMGRFSAIFVQSGALLFFGLFLTMPAFWPSLACAHELRPAIATIEFTEDGDVALSISLNLEAAIVGIGAEHEDTSDSPAAIEYDQLRSLPPSALRTEFDRFAPDFLDQVKVLADDGPVPMMIVTVEIPEVGDTDLPRISLLSLKGVPPFGIERLYWRVDPRLGNSVIRVHDSASNRIRGAEFVLAGQTSGALSVEGLQRQSWISVSMRYLEVGFTHIVPKGLDHILFVIGLFLLSTHLSALLWQVTAFTVAHTVTLALGMVGIVQLSPAVVEPLIAVSIIYVAVENIVTDRLHRWRIVVVFCFGLLHGLGFAGVLQEIGSAPGQFILSLLTFNLGVEFGQLTVITTCFLAVGWTMKKKWYRSCVVIPSSLAIGIIATIWVGERINLG